MLITLHICSTLAWRSAVAVGASSSSISYTRCRRTCQQRERLLPVLRRVLPGRARPGAAGSLCCARLEREAPATVRCDRTNRQTYRDWLGQPQEWTGCQSTEERLDPSAPGRCDARRRPAACPPVHRCRQSACPRTAIAPRGRRIGRRAATRQPSLTPVLSRTLDAARSGGPTARSDQPGGAPAHPQWRATSRGRAGERRGVQPSPPLALERILWLARLRPPSRTTRLESHAAPMR